MAARTNKPNHDERTKERIRASQLLNRLNDFANGKVELSPAQVQAAKIVIGKIVPDLKAVEHSGPNGGAIQSQVSVEFVGQAPGGV
jgi:hypothetical protein